MEQAKWQEGDVHWRKNLAYVSEKFAGNGFVLVGDAAGFLDPFYSPGMDWISFTASGAAELILAERRGEEMEGRINNYNRVFAQSYGRWFEAIYKDKYQYLGDYELMRLVFLLDLGFYYLGVASQPYKFGKKAFQIPVFSSRPSIPFFRLMRLYNRRFARIARERRRRNSLGQLNQDQRFLFGGFNFNPANALHLLLGLGGWIWLEMKEGWRTWDFWKRLRINSAAEKSNGTYSETEPGKTATR